ncbi:MAG: UPF0175 family protein [Chitinophagales bacterium]
MKTLTLQLPDNLEVNEKDLLFSLASSLYAQEKLSLGQAAALIGVDKQVFMKNMRKYGFSLFSTKIEDLQNDFENA